jgi:hypothetical protein
MKFAKHTSIIAIALFTVLALPLDLAAQEHHAKHHHYNLIDLGTFGGPASYFSNGADGILDNQGMAAGWADTPTPILSPLSASTRTASSLTPSNGEAVS